jgi:hypothetical protein
VAGRLGDTAQKGRRRMGMGLETTETIILESGTSLLALGLALLTGGIVGALLARRQYGAVLPLGLVLAAVALLLWGGPLARVLISFLLLVIGYTWLFAWWRASQQGRDQAPSQQSRLASGRDRSSRNRVGVLADSIGRNCCASTTRTALEMRQPGERTCLAGSAPWDEGDARRARVWEGSPVVPFSGSREDGDELPAAGEFCGESEGERRFSTPGRSGCSPLC